MALTTYTSAQEVRAVLGVSSTELPDLVLALPIYETAFLERLDSIDTGVITLLDSLIAAPPTGTNEIRFVRVAKLYIAYSVALQALTALPMFSVKSLTDGKAEFQRQNDVIEQLTNSVTKMWGSLRSTLESLYAVLVAYTPVAAVLPTLSGGVTLTDPITATS